MDGGDEVNNSKRSLITKIVVISIVAVLLISTVVFFYSLNGNSLDFTHSELMVVPTGSMDGEPQPYEIPTIPKGSMVMVHMLSDDQKSDLKIGDVVTFYQGGIHKVHRIIDIDEVNGRYLTQGDANASPDPWISFSDVDGKVVGVSVVIGGIVSFIRDAVLKTPMLFIIGLVLLVLMIYTMIEIIRLIRKGDETE